MDTAKIVEKLNQILRHEWTGVAQYAQASFVVTGLWREVYSKMFSDSAKESFKHAQQIGEKIASYGATPTVERNPIKQSGDLVEMLQHGLEFEQGAVDLYKEALKLADEHDRALVVLLEDILLQEQEGVDEITKLLKEHSPAAAAGDKSTQKAG